MNNLMAFLAESNKQEVFESKIEDFMSRIIYAWRGRTSASEFERQKDRC